MRLIDATKLRETMYHEAFETDSDMQKWDSGCWIRYKMFENNLDNAPTVDAVPVVRCKDCKFWIREKAEAGEAGTYCGEADGMIKPGPDDFCSRGRRKERDDRSHPFADDVMMGGGEE